MNYEVVAEDTGFNEGPVWVPDGSLVIVSIDRGLLYRIWPDEGRKEVFADTAGGPNGLAVTDDGGVLVAQSGGHDLSALDPNAERAPGAPRHYEMPARPRFSTPGLQRVTAAGDVKYLCDDGFTAPNDLVVGDDGAVYFTDPPHDYTDWESLSGRVWVYHGDGRVELVAEKFAYCNGIAIDLDGNLVVIERQGLQKLLPDGTREWMIETVGNSGGDGFCLDVEGRYYVAARLDHGIRIIEHGKEVGFLPVDGEGFISNCCFGGDDLRTLFATDPMAGRVVAWASMPTPGLPLHAWPAG